MINHLSIVIAVRFVSFFLAVLVGVASVNVLSVIDWVGVGVASVDLFLPNVRAPAKPTMTQVDHSHEAVSDGGTGWAACGGSTLDGLFREPEQTSDKKRDEAKGETRPIELVSTPKAKYTDAARAEGIEGAVLLKVTLLASGTIGGISVVRGLDGLNEQAIEAARKIKFKPKLVNGTPVTVVKTIEYGFSLE